MASPHLSAALQAARAATDLIRKAFRGNFQVDYKADASPVTEVDIAAEHAIKSVLAAAFPTYGFRSEEHTSELQSLMRISYAVFCLNKKTKTRREHCNNNRHR